MEIWSIKKQMNMKKYSPLLTFALLTASVSIGQTDSKSYPEPEFTREVYFYNKEAQSVLRLEKGTSKMDTKTKAGGMGGAENSYSIEGSKSPVRLTNGNNLSFVFSTGSSGGSSAASDSVMRANGMDPSMLSASGMGGDPSSMITLYEAQPSGSVRKVILMKMPGMFGGKKLKSSDKQSFSVRKVREGYWELVIDKPLKKGEYAFTIAGAGMGSMDGSTNLFAFGID
jgi:hypothetical protein